VSNTPGDHRDKFPLLTALSVCCTACRAVGQPKNTLTSHHHVICTPEILRPTKTVQAIYPRKAIEKKIEGRVILELTVDKARLLSEVSIIKGNPVLAEATVKAVKQWRYQPYLLNSKPVELDIRVSVDFSLSGQKR
jgi:TonB family protein